MTTIAFIGLGNMGNPMAANLVTIIPTVIVYFFVQKKLIGGIASVGLKG